MSIRPGSRMGSPRSMISPSSPPTSPPTTDDPVVVDPHDARPDDLAGIDVE